MHVVNVCDDLECVVAWHVKFYHRPLPFVEFDGIRFNLYVGMIAPKEFEGVSTRHLFVVLDFDPRLGEVGEDR